MTMNVKRILGVIKIGILLIVSQYLILSCTSRQDKKNQKQQSTVSLITPEQEVALDALNTIQVQTQSQHIYSTFPGLHHDCFPSDSSFVLSSADLLVAMQELIAKYSKDVFIEHHNKLAASAVLAQEEYLVEYCYGTELQMVEGVLINVRTRTSPFKRWILPKVLGRRDLILAW